MGDLSELIKVAREGNFVILDTETTGLDTDSEIVQLAVIDQDGKTLINTLVKPTRPIPSGATAVHGITDEMVVDAPGIKEIWAELTDALTGKHLIIFNAAYDTKLLHQSFWSPAPIPTSEAHPTHSQWCSIVLPLKTIQCAMLAYGEYTGEWNENYGNYKWHKLGIACDREGIQVVDAHHAHGDCLMTLALLRKLETQYAGWCDRRLAMLELLNPILEQLRDTVDIHEDTYINRQIAASGRALRTAVDRLQKSVS